HMLRHEPNPTRFAQRSIRSTLRNFSPATHFVPARLPRRFAALAAVPFVLSTVRWRRYSAPESLHCAVAPIFATVHPRPIAAPVRLLQVPRQPTVRGGPLLSFRS